MIKIYFLISIIFLLFSSLVSAQYINIEEKVIGIVISDSEPTLVTESSYFQLTSKKNDFWLDYYQKIYNDTTLTNPNLEIKNKSKLSIIPIIDFDYSQDNFSQFNSNFSLKDIIILDNNGNYVLTSNGEELIKPYLKSTSKMIKK